MKTLRVNKAKMIRVIKREAKLIEGLTTERRRDRSCERPGHCAIGALLVAAGVSDRSLVSMSNTATFWPEDGRAARTLRREYGLTLDLADTLIEVNDARKTMPARRRAVIAAIRAMPELVSV